MEAVRVSTWRRKAGERRNVKRETRLLIAQPWLNNGLYFDIAPYTGHQRKNINSKELSYEYTDLSRLSSNDDLTNTAMQS